jgi:hypothetical protein
MIWELTHLDCNLRTVLSSETKMGSVTPSDVSEKHVATIQHVQARKFWKF